MGLLTRMHTELNAARVAHGASIATLKRCCRLLLQLICEIADPRGRCNRKAFLHIALAFLALQFGIAAVLWLVGVETSRTGTVLLNAPLFWIGTTVCIKRLHDIGRRGWWIPGAFAIWFVAAMLISMLVSIVLGPDALNEGQPAFLAVFVAITLPAFGALLWLHTAPSVPGGNQFGPAPGNSGLSMPAPRDRSVVTWFAVNMLAA